MIQNKEIIDCERARIMFLTPVDKLNNMFAKEKALKIINKIFSVHDHLPFLDMKVRIM